MALDVVTIKKDFPILDQQVHGRRLVYLDSASSSQKPTSVIDAMDRYYETTHANVHRGVYTIAEQATQLFEAARSNLARFIGAASSEVVFTKNATEAINLVAYAWGRANLEPGDVVVLTEMEHHANLVPWLALKAERGIDLRFLRLTPEGLLDLSDLEAMLRGRQAALACRPCPTCSARSTRSPNWPPPPTPPAPWSWSMAPSTLPTCRPTSRRWAWISLP